MKYLLIAILSVVSTALNAQNKLTYEQAIPGGKEFRKYYPYGVYYYFDNQNEIDGHHSAPITGYDAFCEGGSMFVKIGNDTIRINEEEIDGIVYGRSVHRNEFGIEDGTFWGNKGKKVAFYRMDETMVEKYPIVDISEREAKTKPTRYPMAGMTSHEVKIGIFDTEKREITYLKTESPVNRYFTNISWSADDKIITVAEINRDQNHMWFNVYDAEDGHLIKTLFEETDNHWVEPCEPALFINEKQLVWKSKRDGFDHLYLYNIETGKYTQLTRGRWCVTSIYGYNSSRKEVIFQANAEGYLTRDIYKVNLKGKVTRLSSGYGVHDAELNEDASQYVDNFSSPNIAIDATVRDTDKGQIIETLKHVENPYEGFDLPTIDTVNLKSADNKFDLTGVIVKPSTFDPTKSYPVVVYLYGGPHSQLINASWNYGISTWKLLLAERGYIVFTMDNRGTEFRGKEFEHAIHRQLGKCEMEDQMQGIKYLQSLPYVDKERIGINGWSFGGFMTISMMENHSDIFKVGVAGGPVCDWSLYEVMYGERYMDTPQQNPEGYKLNNISQQTEKIKGRLLVIHGDIDGTVVLQNSLRLLQDAVKKDVLIDFSIYPGHEHNVIGEDRVHLYKKIFTYFDDYL